MAGGANILRWEDPTVRRQESTEAPRRGDASDVEIVLPGRGLQYPGQVTKLSVGGCVIETKCRLEAGTAVEVWLRTEGLPLRVAGTLVERTERGVEFTFHPMPGRKQDQIAGLCRELGLEGATGVQR
ncbi:MAG: PilZ domain-containing protein [Acidobacteriaceae bacterium]